MKLLTYPHPVLKYKCKPLKKIDQELRDIAAEMFDLMYSSEGVGLAANQVGLPYQLFVMNDTGDKEKKESEHCFINPVILKRKGRVADNEGCLSFPDVRADVIRAESIEFEAITLSGETVRFNWKGHPARVVQHETDHLHGIGFVDRLSSTALLEIRKTLQDLQAVFEGDQRLGFVPLNVEIMEQLAELEQKRC
ncbi:MAG: peptide deformylase [Planctomycetaceae bacterium]|jgi:peptide deformylase|nr:peptide deformylase [Planctomycetaceae bacterium]